MLTTWIIADPPPAHVIVSPTTKSLPPPLIVTAPCVINIASRFLAAPSSVVLSIYPRFIRVTNSRVSLLKL